MVIISPANYIISIFLKVCTRYEMEILNANNRESGKLYNRLLEKNKSEEWKKAIEMRNRLLKTDQMGYVLFEYCNLLMVCVQYVYILEI